MVVNWQPVFGAINVTLLGYFLVPLQNWLLGLPWWVTTGAGLYDAFDAPLRPVLDFMQAMPSFVYFIPVVMLFVLGKVPAVIAVVVYALPSVIRLTNLASSKPYHLRLAAVGPRRLRWFQSVGAIYSASAKAEALWCFVVNFQQYGKMFIRWPTADFRKTSWLNHWKGWLE